MVATEAIIGIIAIMTIKVTALVIGFMIVRLGHNTLIRGISGEFKFEGKMSEVTAKLTGASPGVFFVLMGTSLGAWAVFVDKPVTIDRPSFPVSGTEQSKVEESNDTPEATQNRAPDEKIHQMLKTYKQERRCMVNQQ